MVVHKVSTKEYISVIDKSIILDDLKIKLR